MTRGHTIEGNVNVTKPTASGILTFEENLAEARRNREEAHRILKESEPSARAIEEWLNRRRQSQE